MNNSLQQTAENGGLMHINGSVLRTLNVISGGKCRLSDLDSVFSRVTRCRLINSLEYLAKSEYIELKNGTTGSRADLETADYAVLTGKGVQVLQGFIEDDFIEV
ncbi:MAG: hypothetical protein NC205_03810 [Prevotella sp.]|nr:hypothetical protein [Alistipes senegalensis]MCM1357696.1 hypothetical protein [Prevotella sp.]MCM1473435.1 hypothetical protein [Muribaculaceae bacterium]